VIGEKRKTEKLCFSQRHQDAKVWEIQKALLPHLLDSEQPNNKVDGLVKSLL
jgi:hypothetical protein